MVSEYKIGIDIGGTKIRLVLIKGKRLVNKLTIETPKKLKDFNQALNAGVWKLTGNGKHKIFFVGFAVAGVINNSVVDYSQNIVYLNGYNFAQALGFKDGRHMSVDNDARAALWYELKNSSFKKGIVLMLTIGTGIGRALAEAGQVKTIKDFEWPEKWEPDYQKLQRSKELAPYLAYKLWPIIKKYQPRRIIFGGGVVSKRSDLVKEITKYWKQVGYEGKVYKARPNDYAGALGAVL